MFKDLKNYNRTAVAEQDLLLEADEEVINPTPEEDAAVAAAAKCGRKGCKGKGKGKGKVKMKGTGY